MPDCSVTSVTSVTFAPALDCVFSVNWYAAMGTPLVPSEMQILLLPVKIVNESVLSCSGSGRPRSGLRACRR